MSNTEWQLFTKEIENKLTLYSLFGSSPWNSLVICKTTFTLWTCTLWSMTWFYFLMTNCSEPKARQVSESWKSYSRVWILKAQNQERFWSKHYYIENPLLIFSCCYDLMWGATSTISVCMVLTLLCYFSHAIACLTRQTFRWRQAWHNARSLLSFYFSVYMSYVCFLSCFHREICMTVKQNSTLNLYIILALSTDKICFRDPHISPLIGNSLYMIHAAVFYTAV